MKYNHINHIIRDISHKLLTEGEEYSPRGMKTKELINVFCTLTNPKKSICTLKDRKLSMKYLKAELNWYRSGDLSIENIKRYSTMWEKICDDYGLVNSNYGYLAKHMKCNNYITQFGWCVQQLYEDPNSRRAIINFNNPDHKYNGVKDFPCTISQQFYIRNNKLDSITLMRSNDLIYGFCYDVPYFTLLQKEMAQKLNIKLGVYHHYAMSMHVYERHFEMITKIAKEKTQ
tara:strand:+ start:4222 stop:4911 length:690 start_codon:yes stop_codon:yes gene_type:complete